MNRTPLLLLLAALFSMSACGPDHVRPLLSGQSGCIGRPRASKAEPMKNPPLPSKAVQRDNLKSSIDAIGGTRLSNEETSSNRRVLVIFDGSMDELARQVEKDLPKEGWKVQDFVERQHEAEATMSKKGRSVEILMQGGGLAVCDNGMTMIQMIESRGRLTIGSRPRGASCPNSSGSGGD